jgi:ATP-dependent Clp protease protease subunit
MGAKPMTNEDIEFIIPNIPEEVKNLVLPDVYDLTYWGNRKNRTFYVDFEIDDKYELLELSKVIIQMNMDEISIPKEHLKPIYLFVHTYGGDIEQALFFCDLIISSRIPIVTISMGVTMSAGFLIFLAGHKRLAFRHSQFMCHTGSATLGGTAEQVESAQANYKKQLKTMQAYILDRTAIDEKLFNKNKTKDWYISGDDLLNYKIVDGFIDKFDNILL